MRIIIKKPDFQNLFIEFSFLICAFVGSFFIDAENRPTFVFYMVMLGASMFFSFLADNVENNKTCRVFLFIAIIILGYVFAFRAQTGTDDRTYKALFNSISGNSFFTFLNSSGIEKGYLVLNYILHYITGGDYNLAQVIISYITFAIWGIAIYRCKGFCDYSVMVLFCWALYYPIIMGAGLVRIFVSIPIVLCGVTFLFENKYNKFVICIVIAALFHLSSFIVLLLLLTRINERYVYKNWLVIIMVIIFLMPIILIIIARYVIPFLGIRYYHYLNTSGLSLNLSQFDVLPIIILGASYRYKIDTDNTNRYTIGLILASLSIVFSISSSVVNIGRTIFFGNLGNLLVCSAICKTKANKWYEFAVIFVVIAYGFVYMMYAGYLQQINFPNLFPYRSIFN